MTVYLAVNEGELFTNNTFDDQGDEVAVSGVARTGFSRNTNAEQTEAISIPTPQQEGFLHFKHSPASPGTGKTSAEVLRILDGSGAEICSFFWSRDDGEIDFRVTNFSNLNGIYDYTQAPDVDLHYRISESTDGFLRLYVNETLLYDESGITSVSTGEQTIASLEFTANASTGDPNSDSERQNFGQIIVSDEITFGAKVYTLTHAAGSTNDWDLGDYTDIDEKGTSDTDRISTTTNGDEFTLDTSTTLSAPSAPNSYTAVIQSFRAGYDSGSSVTKLTPFVNDTTATSTTDGTDINLTDSFDGYQYIMSTDPADSSPWTADKINDYEFGLRAKT